jgi:hypothetical protein
VWLLGVLAAAPATGVAAAQSPAVGETSLGAVCLLARSDFWGAEAGVARRVGQGRVAVLGAGGWQDGGTALRAEARAQFLVLPAAGGREGGGGGAGYYAGLGLAFAGAERRRGAAYLTVAIGVELAAWRTRGVYAEIGLGGGVRIAAGLRWRRVPAWWP